MPWYKPWYKYHGPNIMVQIPWSKYLGTHTLVHIPWYKYLGTNTMVQIPWYKYDRVFHHTTTVSDYMAKDGIASHTMHNSYYHATVNYGDTVHMSTFVNEAEVTEWSIQPSDTKVYKGDGDFVKIGVEEYSSNHFRDEL